MKFYIIDAFTDQPFHGNPAAICFTDKWPKEETMKKIVKENNLPETAFAIKRDTSHYDLRWFTPITEVELCGHATLATASVIFSNNQNLDQITFNTKSGNLIVTKKKDIYELAFPSYQLKKIPVTDEMEKVFGVRPVETYMGRDLVCIFDNENIVRNMHPSQTELPKLGGVLQHVTAPGKDFDCVSRSFAPNHGIPEDQVNGVGHCHFISYWAKRLNKENIKAYQASERGGILYCRYDGDKTYLAGKTVQYLQGELNIK